jgi:hypothetical protein
LRTGFKSRSVLLLMDFSASFTDQLIYRRQDEKPFLA